MTTSLILGAGFSFAAGFPLTSQLFETSELPKYQSKNDRQRLEAVASAYMRRSTADEANAELWMRTLYADRSNPEAALRNGIAWDDAMRFALRRLTHVTSAKSGPYYYGIARHHVHPVHDAFWKKILSTFDVKYILTTNYDILIERALHSVTPDGTQPRFYYGGFMYEQHVRKMIDITKHRAALVPLGHDFAIYKLHGSLNWAFEPHSLTMKIHDDVRAVYRIDSDFGLPAIVPPVPEKELPEDFANVWREAAKALQASDTWVVCGYSMPDYDEALVAYFTDALSASSVRRIVVMDPNGDEIARKWESIASSAVRVDVLPGLPEALQNPWGIEEIEPRVAE